MREFLSRLKNIFLLSNCGFCGTELAEVRGVLCSNCWNKIKAYSEGRQVICDICEKLVAEDDILGLEAFDMCTICRNICIEISYILELEH